MKRKERKGKRENKKKALASLKRYSDDEVCAASQVERSYLYANTGTRVSQKAKEILHVEIKRNDISVLGFLLFPLLPSPRFSTPPF